MPKNKIEDLRNMLFETMERLLDDTDEKMDLERAETISKVAQTVINSAKVEHSAIVRWEDCSVAEDAVLDAEILTTD
ncbi:MAG: hypothetical protein R2682_01805 [Pyrinomonadaceae bacterium]